MGKKAAIPDNVDDDDALDMFADNLDGDAKKTEKKAPIEETKDPVLLGDVSTTKLVEPTLWKLFIHSIFVTCHIKVSWEFKWKTEDAELHGPHTSQKMLDWQVQ